MTLRARANRGESQRGTRTSSPAVHLSRPGSQRRTSRGVAPPSDPGLRAFLEEVGRMAADAVLERLQNTPNIQAVGEASRKSPRVIYSTAGEAKMAARAS